MKQDIVIRMRMKSVVRWVHSPGGTPRMQGHKPDPDAREAAAEIEQLRAANDAFGRRQEWWTSRMFDLEQEVERLRAVERAHGVGGKPRMYGHKPDPDAQEAAAEIDRFRTIDYMRVQEIAVQRALDYNKLSAALRDYLGVRG